MELDPNQRRDLIALLCHLAWADGVVIEAEQKYLIDGLHRLGDGAVTKGDLFVWLTSGPPAVTEELPEFARETFYEEALRLISTDGDCDPHEMRALNGLLQAHFARAPSRISIPRVQSES